MGLTSEQTYLGLFPVSCNQKGKSYKSFERTTCEWSIPFPFFFGLCATYYLLTRENCDIHHNDSRKETEEGEERTAKWGNIIFQLKTHENGGGAF